MVISGEGDVYSGEEMSGWLRQTGWTTLGMGLLNGSTSLLVAEVNAA
jgi:hypothetical protein